MTDKKEKNSRNNIKTYTLTQEEWIDALYPPPKPKTEREKRVLKPRKERKNECVAEYYTKEELVKNKRYIKMIDKFENLPVSSDTKILFELPAHFGDYDVLYQKFYCDGLIAESLTFVTEDYINNITMAELETDIRNSKMVNDSSKEITTSSGKSEFTFFNFNFVMDDD